MEGRRIRRILELTKRVERARQGELSEARSARDAAQSALERARALEGEHVNGFSNPGDLPPEVLLDRARHVMAAVESVRHAERACETHEGEVSRREEASFAAVRDVRKFEVLSERSKQEERNAARLAEQRALDDLSARRGAP
jgi:flagellar export protein FliJ